MGLCKQQTSLPEGPHTEQDPLVASGGWMNPGVFESSVSCSNGSQHGRSVQDNRGLAVKCQRSAEMLNGLLLGTEGPCICAVP